MTKKLIKTPLEYPRSKDRSIDEMFMGLAINVSGFSSCARVKVGAVLVVENRPLLSGYNGTPKGYVHCIDVFKEKYQNYIKGSTSITFEEFMKLPEIREEHGKFSRKYEVHAEMNIIAQAAYKGLATKGSTLYVTHSPCNDCAKSILTAGIKEVVFLSLYDRETDGLINLYDSGLTVRQLQLTDKRHIVANDLYTWEEE